MSPFYSKLQIRNSYICMSVCMHLCTYTRFYALRRKIIDRTRIANVYNSQHREGDYAIYRFEFFFNEFCFKIRTVVVYWVFVCLFFFLTLA